MAIAIKLCRRRPVLSGRQIQFAALLRNAGARRRARRRFCGNRAQPARSSGRLASRWLAGERG